MTSKKHIFSLRLDESLRQTLDYLANKEGRSLNNFIHKILNDFVDEKNRSEITTDVYIGKDNNGKITYKK